MGDAFRLEIFLLLGLAYFLKLKLFSKSILNLFYVCLQGSVKIRKYKSIAQLCQIVKLRSLRPNDAICVSVSVRAIRYCLNSANCKRVVLFPKQTYYTYIHTRDAMKRKMHCEMCELNCARASPRTYNIIRTYCSPFREMDCS